MILCGLGTRLPRSKGNASSPTSPQELPILLEHNILNMPTRQTKTIFTLIIIIGGLFSACNMSQGTAIPTLEPGGVYTLAAHTVSAQLTLAAGGTPSPPDEAFPAPTQIIEPIGTPSPVDELAENLSLPETDTPSAERLYDHLTFIEDVTYPDGADVSPGMLFTKTWRVQNTGTHAWTSGYSLVFEGGEAMGATASLQFTKNVVEPGEIIDISVDLIAPEVIGTYQGYWMLRNLEGKLFGAGDLSQPFWVKIDVVKGLDVAFDFNAYADEAEWGVGSVPVDFDTLGTDELTFGPPPEPGVAFVDLQNNLDLEDGRLSSWVLETYPAPGTGNYLVGKYPPHTVNAGENLTGRVGLLANSDGSCGAGDVKFQVNYTVDDNLSTMKTLWGHQDNCDGKLHDFEVDLSDLAGQEVDFYLLVIAAASTDENYAIWDSLIVKR